MKNCVYQKKYYLCTVIPEKSIFYAVIAMFRNRTEKEQAYRNGYFASAIH